MNNSAQKVGCLCKAQKKEKKCKFLIRNISSTKIVVTTVWNYQHDLKCVSLRKIYILVFSF